MRLVRLAFVLTLVVAPVLAQARPWKGVNPGTTTGAEVEQRFGEPTKRTKHGNRTILAYYGDGAPEGAKQAQFHVDAGGVVQEITIFLTTPLDPETIEGTYGKPSQKTFVEDTFQKVWVFASQGVTVYWAKDGGGAEALSFGPARAAAKPSAEGAKAGAEGVKPAAGGN